MNRTIPLLFDERFKSTRVMLLIGTLIAISTWPLAGCTAHQSEAHLVEWGDSLVDAQISMNEYQLRLETIRDAFESDAGLVEQCNPAQDKKAHEVAPSSWRAWVQMPQS